MLAGPLDKIGRWARLGCGPFKPYENCKVLVYRMFIPTLSFFNFVFQFALCFCLLLLFVLRLFASLQKTNWES